MGAFELITSRQRSWALQRDLSVDKRGYLPSVDQNLFAPLSCATYEAFASGAGHELEARNGKPAKKPVKMRALHSSSALVCNLFDYWSSRDRTAIGRSFGLSVEVKEIRFEHKLQTGLPGTPPTLDMLILDQSGNAYAVESKFSEPFRSHGNSEPFKSSYFKDCKRLWTKHGLPRCQQLAERLHCGEKLFRYLDAPQLLKHAIGLKRAYSTGELVLLWFDPGHSGEQAAFLKEIEMFKELVDAELGFTAITHQTVFASLKTETNADPDYVNYLEQRYFAV